jgi:uncharacterized protein (DUF427 family)
MWGPSKDGDAAYYCLSVDGRTAGNAAWTYERPFPAMAAIKEYLAFYPARVDRIEEVGEVVELASSRKRSRGPGPPFLVR